MIDVNGHEMSLTPDAERVCADLVSKGARATSGYRHLARQCHAMAVNVCLVTFAPDDAAQQHPLLHRDWIGRTYRHGQAMQDLVDEHPEWDTVETLSQQLFYYLSDHPEVTQLLSHHLKFPCPCFDLDPSSITEPVRAKITAYQAECVITQVLWQEAGLPKCHVEIGSLPANKVEEV